jgi:hypothetical protein
MRQILFSFLVTITSLINAQQLQFHRDYRHTIDSKNNPSNFSSFNFEYFNNSDTIGSFLFKSQVDFNGEKGNQNEVFIQISKNFRSWKPDVFLSLGYSGGIGITPTSFGYSISNSYSFGISYPFQWKEFYCAITTGYRYNAFAKSSHDMHVTFYFWKGLLNYKLSLSGSFVGWTQNRDLGIEFTENLEGKKFAFYADPQIWLKTWKKISIGSKISILYNLENDRGNIKGYPTLGLKYEF